MVSIQELIAEVTAVRNQSEKLAGEVAAANQDLGRQGMAIAALVRGSRTGQNAVQAVQVASQALNKASASMTALDRTCEVCIGNLEK